MDSCQQTEQIFNQIIKMYEVNLINKLQNKLPQMSSSVQFTGSQVLQMYFQYKKDNEQTAVKLLSLIKPNIYSISVDEACTMFKSFMQYHIKIDAYKVIASLIEYTSKQELEKVFNNLIDNRKDEMRKIFIESGNSYGTVIEIQEQTTASSAMNIIKKLPSIQKFKGSQVFRMIKNMHCGNDKIRFINEIRQRIISLSPDDINDIISSFDHSCEQRQAFQMIYKFISDKSKEGAETAVLSFPFCSPDRKETLSLLGY